MIKPATHETPAQAAQPHVRVQSRTANWSSSKPQPKRGNSFARTVIAEVSPLVESNCVPVSFVAKDWNVTPRRIRSLLSAHRLEGRQQVNGYWEVCYPYHFIIGTRGPQLKRQQKPKRGRPKLVGSAE